MIDNHRSKNVYRSITALASIIHVSSMNRHSIGPLLVAVSETNPFISHVNAVVEALDNSRPEKQYFQALVRLARAPTILYGQPDNFVCTLRRDLIQVIRLYRYVHH